MTSKNSTSLLRKPTGKEDFVRGRTGQFPFSPGGLELNALQTSDRYKINEKTQLGPLPSLPPGFTRGLRVKHPEEDLDLESTEINDEDEAAEVIRSVHHSQSSQVRKKESIQTGYEGIDDLLPDEVRLFEDSLY